MKDADYCVATEARCNAVAEYQERMVKYRDEIAVLKTALKELIRSYCINDMKNGVPWQDIYARCIRMSGGTREMEYPDA